MEQLVRQGTSSGPGAGLTEVSSLRTRCVVDAAGKVIGSLVDLMLDLERGCVAYAVVASGGFVGVGERLFAVPWAALRAEGERFVLSADPQALAAAPEFDRDHWPRAPSVGWHRHVHDHFHSRPYWE